MLDKKGHLENSSKAALNVRRLVKNSNACSFYIDIDEVTLFVVVSELKFTAFPNGRHDYPDHCFIAVKPVNTETALQGQLGVIECLPWSKPVTEFALPQLIPFLSTMLTGEDRFGTR